MFPSAVGLVAIASALLGAGPLQTQERLPSRILVPDLENRPIDPFGRRDEARAVVFVFLATDCPISNRYAPVIRQLFDTFRARKVSAWLVYPNGRDTPEAIRQHLTAFGLPRRALRDPLHQLVDRVKVTVTPEAVVYDAHLKMAYRGRIDDRYAHVGIERPTPSRNDLDLAIRAVLAGEPVAQPNTNAVGCFIADGSP